MPISTRELEVQVRALLQLQVELRRQCQLGYHLSNSQNHLRLLKRIKRLLHGWGSPAGWQLKRFQCDRLLFKLLDDVQWAKALIVGWPDYATFTIKQVLFEIKGEILSTLILAAPKHDVQVRVGISTDDPTMLSVELTCLQEKRRPFYVHWPINRVSTVVARRIERDYGEYPPRMHVHPSGNRSS